MALPNAQILVVEDEARTAVQIQRELERLGYSVTVLASSATDAVAKAAETHPDLVVMDAKRQHETVEAARQMRDRYGIPVAYLQLYGRSPAIVPQGTSPLLDSLRNEIDKELSLTIDEALNQPQGETRSLVWEPSKRPSRSESRRPNDSQWLGTILRAVADGVVATDRDGIVRFINPVAQELTGWSEQKALGKPIGLIVSSEPPVDQHPPSAPGDTRHSPTVEAMLVRSDGRRTAIEQNGTPIHDDAGRPAGFVYALRDITDRRRVQAELEQMNRLKSDFVATMSHELRAPLHVIMGYNDLLLTGEFGGLSDEQTTILQRVHDTARQLAEVIQTTLDWSRLETGRVQLERRRTNVRELVETIDVDMQELQDKPGVEFIWEVAADVPAIDTDPIKLKVVLRNLISNAMKFTAAGRVTITAAAAEDGVQFRVSDTGIGIGPEAQAMIFEPFRQVEGAGGSYSGVGLGLYIVRRFLALLGGRVELESELGHGSTFIVWVPRIPPR